jgi:hypothetical protein
MSNRNDRRRPAAAGLLALAALAATAVTLMLVPPSGPARAGAVPDEARSAFDSASAARAAPPPSRHYQLRCWQRGHLVIEENYIEKPTEATMAPGGDGMGTSLRLRALDSRRRPMYLTETENATCLLRPMDAEPGLTEMKP